MSKILLATNNTGKLVEIQALLANTGIEPILPRQININLKVTEDGQTYTENASRKAVAFTLASQLPSLADDSGLEVDALGGRPGLYSARFSPLLNASDADRRAYLLDQLAAFPRPWLARFRCIVALITPLKVKNHLPPHIFEGVCPGEIIPEERGSHGFGYDPIFIPDGYKQTFAMMQKDEKNRISHRGQALKRLITVLSHLHQI